jgi:type III secretory pathway lipoprotein EscJ
VQSKEGSSSSSSPAQDVAQVLTQAQYELSQELEANLKKLRGVIQQSQEIAKKIELVLGQGSKGSGQGQ